MEQDEIKTTIQEHGKPSEQAVIDNLHKAFISLKDEGNTAENITETIERLQAVYRETGLFIPLPSAALLPKSEAVFNSNIARIRTELSNSGVTAETVEAVTQDYGKAITGDYLYKATPAQMLEVLKKVKPYKAFLIDKYVLYYGVMTQYSRCLAMVGKFNDAFRVEGATPETKTAFMDAQYSAFEAVALGYLWDRHYFTYRDFDGIERNEVITWLDGVESWGHVGKYAMYYTLSKLVLGASTDELKTILPPPYFPTPEKAQEYAETYCKNVETKLSELYGKVVELIEADTAQEQEQAKQEVENWDSKTNKEPVRLSNTLLSVQTRPVYVANDEKAQYTAPIEVAINQYVKDKGLKHISPYKVEQVFGCINYLLRFGNPTNNGYITIETSLSAFANEVLGFDANGEQKAEILTALEVLDGAYIVIPSPRKVDAIRMLVIKRRTLHDTGQLDLEIEVSGLVKKGATQVISATDYKKLKKQGKGQIQSRFNAMLLNKGHIKETGALDDIFGYSAEVDVAVRMGKPEAEIKKIKDNQKKHLSRDKRKLEQMFEKAAADGLITYVKKQTGTGKHNVPIYVYEWHRLRIPELTAEHVQEPDEQ